jgi:hypothetical protein
VDLKLTTLYQAIAFALTVVIETPYVAKAEWVVGG